MPVYSGNIGGTLTSAAQNNITSVGNLVLLQVASNITTQAILTDNYYFANGTPVPFGGNGGNGGGGVTQVNAGTGLTGGPITTSGTLSIANTTVTAGDYGAADSVSTFTVNGQGQLTSASNTTIAITNAQVSGLGTMSTQDASNVSITGGTITTTNTITAGNFTTSGSAGNITGANNISASNTTQAGSFVMGNASIAMSTTDWTTNVTGTTSPTIIYQIPVTSASSLDFNITSTDETSGTSRQVAKIMASALGNAVNYNEYGTLAIGSSLGSYAVSVVGGNYQLIVTPATANTITYNVVVTAYA